MKKYLFRFCLFLCFVFVNYSSKAQKGFPVFSDNPSWNVLECFWNNCTTKNYHFDYDTTLCGKSYSKVTFSSGENAYFRSDSLKTYFRKSNSCADKEYLIYDYSLNIGDTVFVGYDLCCNTGKDTAQFVVGEVDSINYFGIERKRFKMFFDPSNLGGQFFRQMYWIQNIGSDVHPFYPFKCLWDGCEESNFLLCYDSSGTQLFQDSVLITCDTTLTGIDEHRIENKFNIFPNPFQNKINVELKDIHVAILELFSYTGVLMQNFYIEGESNFSLNFEKLNPGIYFLRLRSNNIIVFKRIMKG